jgi:hypothetical protein
MMHYLRYFLKMLFGLMVIVALDVILKKADPSLNDWWFYLTLIFYNGYCYIDYRLNDKDE